MFLYLIHLVVSGNVFMQGSQQNHGNHARQEEDNDQGVHDAVQAHKGQSSVKKKKKTKGDKTITIHIEEFFPSIWI